MESKRKEIIGIVVSDKNDKTITIKEEIRKTIARIKMVIREREIENK